MDARVTRAQQLHWEIDALLRLGVHGVALRAKRREAATVHEDIARERLAAGDHYGWTDLFAAVTYWAEAGHAPRAHRLLQFGAPLASEAIAAELESLRTWMNELAVVPALEEFATTLPTLPEAVAA